MATSAEHQSAPHLHFDEEGLLSVRMAAGYNRAEQQYSTLIYRRIEQLLKGERNRLLLLRKYPLETNRLGIMPTPGIAVLVNLATLQPFLHDFTLQK